MPAAEPISMSREAIEDINRSAVAAAIQEIPTHNATAVAEATAALSSGKTTGAKGRKEGGIKYEN